MTRRSRLPDPAAGPPSFLEGALVALLAAVGASLGFGLLDLILTRAAALGMTVAALGLGYMIYLLGRSRERAGRLVMVLGWTLVTGIAWSIAPDPWTQVLVQTGILWLVRVLYFQSTPTGALLDLGLALVGLAAAVSAGGHTGSLFLAVWCLFLIQAPFGAIPAMTATAPQAPSDSDPFDLAERAAQAALRQIGKSPFAR